MAIFDLYIDETGTVGSDRDDEPFGCGFVICERGTDLDELRKAIVTEFPNGFHLKTIRRRRKLARAKKLLSLLSDTGHFYVGGHVFTDPSYGRDKYFRAVSGLRSDSQTPPRWLVGSVNAAPETAGGLVDPNDVAPISRDAGRLLSIYSASLRFPMVALMRAKDPPSKFEVHAHLGTVALLANYQRQMKQMAPSLTANWKSSFHLFLQRGLIEPRPCHLIVETTRADQDPVFGIADLMAGVAHHVYKARIEPTDGLGDDLLEAAASALGRLPWCPSGQLAYGITRYPE